MSSKAAAGDCGRLLGGARWTEPGLDLARHRLLGDHQQGEVHALSTRVMSRTVRAVPSRLPVTLDTPPTLGRVVNVDLLDPPPGPGGLEHHLQRIAEPPILQVERDQCLAPGGTHRTEVVHRRAGRAAQPPSDGSIADAGMQREGAAVGRSTPPEHQIGPAAGNGRRDPGQLSRVE